MDTRSTGEVIASLIVNAQAMVEKEVELARLELRRIVARKVAAVVILLLGALALAAVVLLGAMTAAVALEDVLAEPWMAWGVVTLTVTVIALILLAVAARTLASGWSLDVSRRSATTTGAWLRGLGEELTGTTRSDATTDRPARGDEATGRLR